MADSFRLAVRQEYISVACNRNPLCLDWGLNGLVAFGAHNSVALYQPGSEGSDGKIECVLYGHKDRVNCVKWISKEDQAGQENELVSGGIDSVALIWKYSGNKWIQCDSLIGHNGAIIALSAIVIGGDAADSRTLVATASADSTVKIWQREGPEGNFKCSDTINLEGGFAFSVALSTLPGTKVLILACGCEDAMVHLFTQTNAKFVHALKLVGHEDWIRAVNFVDIDCGDLMLASSSQDSSIRVWRIVKEQTSDLASACASNNIEGKLEDLMLTSNTFTAMLKDISLGFSVVLETILAGHEGWVYGVCWHPKIREGNKVHQPLCLMSSSMDKTIVVWKLDEQSGVWMDEVRVGEVGGNTLGFYGGKFSPDGKAILAHSYQGALHMWRKQTDTTRAHSWEAAVTVSGHFGPVQDLAWDPEGGEFLVTLSSDQTTRIHAPWRRQGHETTWHEISRPQIHGYNMQCLAMISRYSFASGADEKVIRVFDAPKSFLEKFTFLCQIKDENIDNYKPLGASVPVLGLSNKAVFADDLQTLKDDLKDPQRPMKASAFASEEPAPFAPSLSKEPPTENNLLQNTLWPETQKLYGHGYEIFSLAYDPGSKILASSCKASKADYANILLWDTISWKLIGSLEGHALTITQMEFSYSGKYLLSVSRDRSWCLFEQTNEENIVSYRIAAKTDKKSRVHSRIIWSCAWTADDCYFLTASRDKKVVVWGKDVNQGDWLPVGCPLDVGEPVTAVAVSSVTPCPSGYLVSVGTDLGKILLYNWSQSSGWTNCTVQETILCHTATIKRLRWRPCNTRDSLYLASCSSDNSVKIYEITHVS